MAWTEDSLRALGWEAWLAYKAWRKDNQDKTLENFLNDAGKQYADEMSKNTKYFDEIINKEKDLDLSNSESSRLNYTDIIYDKLEGGHEGFNELAKLETSKYFYDNPNSDEDYGAILNSKDNEIADDLKLLQLFRNEFPGEDITDIAKIRETYKDKYNLSGFSGNISWNVAKAVYDFHKRDVADYAYNRGIELNHFTAGNAKEQENKLLGIVIPKNAEELAKCEEVIEQINQFEQEGLVDSEDLKLGVSVEGLYDTQLADLDLVNSDFKLAFEDLIKNDVTLELLGDKNFLNAEEDEKKNSYKDSIMIAKVAFEWELLATQYAYNKAQQLKEEQGKNFDYKKLSHEEKLKIQADIRELTKNGSENFYNYAKTNPTIKQEVFAAVCDCHKYRFDSYKQQTKDLQKSLKKPSNPFIKLYKKGDQAYKKLADKCPALTTFGTMAAMAGFAYVAPKIAPFVFTYVAAKSAFVSTRKMIKDFKNERYNPYTKEKLSFKQYCKQNKLKVIAQGASVLASTVATVGLTASLPGMANNPIAQKMQNAMAVRLPLALTATLGRLGDGLQGPLDKRTGKRVPPKGKDKWKVWRQALVTGGAIMLGKSGALSFGGGEQIAYDSDNVTNMSHVASTIYGIQDNYLTDSDFVSGTDMGLDSNMTAESSNQSTMVEDVKGNDVGQNNDENSYAGHENNQGGSTGGQIENAAEEDGVFDNNNTNSQAGGSSANQGSSQDGVSGGNGGSSVGQGNSQDGTSGGNGKSSANQGSSQDGTSGGNGESSANQGSSQDGVFDNNNTNSQAGGSSANQGSGQDGVSGGNGGSSVGQGNSQDGSVTKVDDKVDYITGHRTAASGSFSETTNIHSTSYQEAQVRAVNNLVSNPENTRGINFSAAFGDSMIYGHTLDDAVNISDMNYHGGAAPVMRDMNYHGEAAPIMDAMNTPDMNVAVHGGYHYAHHYGHGERVVVIQETVVEDRPSVPHGQFVSKEVIDAARGVSESVGEVSETVGSMSENFAEVNARGIVFEDVKPEITTVSTDNGDLTAYTRTVVENNETFQMVDKFGADGVLVEHHDVVISPTEDGGSVKNDVWENAQHEQKETSDYYDKDGNLTLHQDKLFTYDPSGNNVVHTMEYDGNRNCLGSTEYVADKDNNPISEIREDADGNLVSKTEWTSKVDVASGQVADIATTKNADGNIIAEQTNIYDKDDNFVRSTDIIRSADGQSVDYQQVQEVIGGKTIITTDNYADDSKPYHQETVVSENGQIESDKIINRDGSYSTINHQYNDKGAEISAVRSNFDANGNLTGTEQLINQESAVQSKNEANNHADSADKGTAKSTAQGGSREHLQQQGNTDNKTSAAQDKINALRGAARNSSEGVADSISGTTTEKLADAGLLADSNISVADSTVVSKPELAGNSTNESSKDGLTGAVVAGGGLVAGFVGAAALSRLSGRNGKDDNTNNKAPSSQNNNALNSPVRQQNGSERE